MKVKGEIVHRWIVIGQERFTEENEGNEEGMEGQKRLNDLKFEI